MSDKQAKSAESKLQTMLRSLFGGTNAEERDASSRKVQTSMRVANRELLTLLVRSGAESATVRERLHLVAKALEYDANCLNEECLGVVLEVLKVALHDLHERETENANSQEDEEHAAIASESSCRTDWLVCAFKVATRSLNSTGIALKAALFDLLNEEATSAMATERRRSKATEEEQWLKRVQVLALLSASWSSVGELPDDFAALLVTLQCGIELDSAAENEYLRLLREALQRHSSAFNEAELCVAVRQTCSVLQSTRSADCVEACFALLETCVGADRGNVCGMRPRVSTQSNAAAGAACGCLVQHTVRGCLVPLAALDELVRLLVQFANNDRFGRRACSIARRLLTADEPAALRCVMALCSMLHEAEVSVAHGNYALLRGTVTCLAATFWGREAVPALRHFRPLVLPAFITALRSFECDVGESDSASRYAGFVLFASELILWLNRIPRAELQELTMDEWGDLFDLSDLLLTNLRFTDFAETPMQLESESFSVLFETHKLLRNVHALHEECRFVGHEGRLYELLERVAACISERRVRLGPEQRGALNDTVCKVLQHRLAHECQMGATGWLSNLRALMRQHSLDASSQVLTAPTIARQKQNLVQMRYRASLCLVTYLSEACTHVQFDLFADELLLEASPFLSRLLEHVQAALRSFNEIDLVAHADADWPLLKIVHAIVNYCCTTLARLALLSPGESDKEQVGSRLLDKRAPQLLTVLEGLAAVLFTRLSATVDKDAPLFGEAQEADLAMQVTKALETLANRLTDLLRQVLDYAPSSACARNLFELVAQLLRIQLASLIPAARVARACAVPADADADDEFADALEAYLSDAIRHTLGLSPAFQSSRPAAETDVCRPVAARLETCRCTLLTCLLELRSDRAAQRVGDARVLAHCYSLDYDLVEKLLAVMLEFECSVTVFEKLLCELPTILADRNKHSSEFVNALCKWFERWLTDKNVQPLQMQRFGFDQEQKRVSKDLVGKLQGAAFETILALIGHSCMLHMSQQTALLRCLVDGLTSAGAGCRPLIVLALIVALYQVPRSVLSKQLPRAVIEMSKLMSSPQLAVLILEFLSHLRQQPALYDSFTQRQLMAVFAVCVPYTEPAYHHFVVTFAYRSIVQWFITCPPEQRRGLVSYILSSVQLNVKNASTKLALDPSRVHFHRLLYETCADLIARFCFEPRARDVFAFPSAFPANGPEKRLFQDGQSETWLVGNSIYKVTTPNPARLACPVQADVLRRGSQPPGVPHSFSVQSDVHTASAKRRHRSAVDSASSASGVIAQQTLTLPSRVASTDDLGNFAIDSCRSDSTSAVTATARCAEVLVRRACGTTRCMLTFADDNEPYGPQVPLLLAGGSSLSSDVSLQNDSVHSTLEDSRRETCATNVTPAEVILRMLDPLILSENALLLGRDDATVRALKNLDRIPAFESHSIGVIYVGVGQSGSERDILSNCCGSRRYHEFLERLGEFVRLRDLPVEYSGGLDTSENALDGMYTVAWNDTTVRVLFHVGTLMPTKRTDVQCTAKKRHVGNDCVLIVYDDSGAKSAAEKFRIGTIGGQLGYANIVIEPLGDSISAVSMQVKPELNDALGIAVANRRCVHISDQNVAAFVRQVAVQADLAALVFQKTRMPNDPFASNFVERARQIERIRNKLLEKRSEAAQGTDISTANARFLNAHSTFLDFTNVLLQHPD